MKKNEKYKQVGQYLDLGYFEWRKADKGYYWDREAIDAERKIKGPFLLIKPESGYTWYNPLIDTATLFLEFSELELNENQILEFANKYGMLSEYETLLHPAEGQRSELFGESIEFWRREIADMHVVVDLWNALKQKNTYKLNQFITWEDKEEVKYILGTQKSGFLNKLNSPFSRFNFGDVFLPAQYVIQNEINVKLGKYPTNPRLIMDNKNQLKQYLTPSSLLAAMWFQFYQAVTGEKLFKRCEVCRKWEDVTNNKVTWSKHPECAGRERAANYRERKKEILNLCAEGKTIDEIAQITEVDIKQIKKWIEKERRV